MHFTILLLFLNSILAFGHRCELPTSLSDSPGPSALPYIFCNDTAGKTFQVDPVNYFFNSEVPENLDEELSSDDLDAFVRSAQIFREMDELFTKITSSGSNSTFRELAIQTLYERYLHPEYDYTLTGLAPPNITEGQQGQPRICAHVHNRTSVLSIADVIANSVIFRYTIPPVVNLVRICKMSRDPGDTYLLRRRLVEIRADINHDVLPVTGGIFKQFGKFHGILIEVEKDVFRMRLAQLDNYKYIRLA